MKVAIVITLISLLSTWVLVGAGQARSAPTAALDEITIAKQSGQRGTIVGMSPTEVTIKVNRTEVRVPVNEIVRIDYGLEPAELRAARRLAARQSDLALKKLNGINVSQVTRDLIIGDIAYYKAYATARIALYNRGDKRAASKLMVEFISEYKDNYHYFDALEILGNLAAADSQYDLADRYYRDIAKAPWPAYALKATVLGGQSLQTQKKYQQAVEEYEKVIAASKGIPGRETLEKFATLGKMACLIATGRYPRKAMGPNAELHGSATNYYGDGGGCCWDFDLWQHWGSSGNITYIDAQVTTAGVTVTSVSGPVPGPGSQPPVFSPTSMRWYLPQPDGLWMAPQTVTACFDNIPASGATVVFTGYDNAGNTQLPLQQLTLNIDENGECGYLSDLWMKDTMAPDLPEDFGVEANNVSSYFWISSDIWVRTIPDTVVSGGSNPGPDTTSPADRYYANEHQHQNPAYVDAVTPSYVYVKIRNKGLDYNYNQQMLHLYWASASTGLSWPTDWNEINCMQGTGNPYPLPAIAPLQDYVVQVPWVPPNPASFGGSHHFCLVARIESVPWAPYGMHTAETSLIWQNVANNNNIVWKNVTVVTVPPIGTSVATLIVSNPLDRKTTLSLRFSVPKNELKTHFLLHGNIFVDLGDALMTKWRRGGQPAQGFVIAGRTTIKLTDPSNAVLGGLTFGAREKQTIEVRMQLKPGDRSPANTRFNWDVVEWAPLSARAKPSAIGGERYVLTVPGRRSEQTSPTTAQR